MSARPRRVFRSVDGEKLFCGALGVGFDFLDRRREFVAEQQADLHVAHDEAEEGPERRFRIVESEQPRVAAGFEYRLQSLTHGEAPIVEDDGAKAVILGCVGDGEAIELVIRGEGPRVLLDPLLRDTLTKGIGDGPVEPRAAGAWLAHELAAEGGGSIQLSAPADELLIIGARIFRQG